MLQVHTVARIVVFAAFCVALLIAVMGWVVRTRRVSPFSALGRTLRAVSDPFTKPVERRLVAAGASPVNAGWWLVIGTALLGVLLLSLIDWLIRMSSELSGAAHGGARGIAGLAITLVYNVLFVALLVRVLGSWIGMFRYSRWMRPAYALTDWLVEPIRRVLPNVGMFDLSPLVAWLVLWLLERFLLTLL